MLNKTDGFNSTGFNYKKSDDIGYNTKYSSSPSTHEKYENMHTAGEYATTNPETNYGGSQEKSMSFNIHTGERGYKSKKDRSRLRGPDFKKLLSRDYLDRLHEDKRTVIPFSKPNYNYTTNST